MLLLRFHRLALQLRPFLPWCYVAGFSGAALSLILVLLDDSSSQWLSLALGLTVWALMLFAFIRLFQSIPPPVLPKDTWFERLWSRCKLVLYHLLAFFIVLIGLALVSMSLKLLSAS